MARHKTQHPLGKVSEGPRLDLAMPPELRKRLELIATLNGKSATTWARDVLEKAIEGEWAFMQRRFSQSGANDNGKNTR